MAASLGACGSGGTDIVEPADLSTGPALQWSEMDLGFDFAMSLQSTSDGRVLAVGGMSDGGFAARVTDDGEVWSALPLPDGIAPLAIDAHGDRWVLTGAPPGRHDGAGVFGQVFFTDDRGASWIEASLDSLPDDPLPQYATRSMRVVEALTSGDQTVVAVLTYSGFDLESLLGDQGRTPDGTHMTYWQPDDESLTVSFRDIEPVDGAADETEVTLSYVDLGLTPSQVEVVLNVESDVRIHLFAGSDATLDWVGAFGGSDAAGKWTDEGFVLLLDDWSHVSPQPRAPRGPDWEGVILIVTLDDPSRISSADGHTWRADPLSQYTDSSHRESSIVDASGVVWSTWSASDGRWVSLHTDSGSGSSQETARFAGIRQIEPLAAGDAGLAAVAWPRMPDRWSYARSGRIAKDGYELRYDEPDGGLTLWDLGRDTATYEFASRRTEAPEGSRQVGVGKSYQLVFEDHNADELVRFTATDLQQLFGRCWWTSGRPNVFSTQARWWAGPFPEFREWVGWSVDGAEWGWESIADAFDQCESGTKTSLAIGDDYVVALTNRVDRPPRISDQSNGGREMPPPGEHHWFIANVP